MPNVNSACAEERKAHCSKARCCAAPLLAPCVLLCCGVQGWLLCARRPPLPSRLHVYVSAPRAEPWQRLPPCPPTTAQVPTGKGRVINCLLAKAGDRADFSPVCLSVLEWLARRRLEDWRTGGRVLLRAAAARWLWSVEALLPRRSCNACPLRWLARPNGSPASAPASSHRLPAAAGLHRRCVAPLCRAAEDC